MAKTDSKTQRDRKPAGSSKSPARHAGESAPKAPKVRARRPAAGTKHLLEGSARAEERRPDIRTAEATAPREVRSAELSEVLQEIRSLRAAIEPMVKPPRNEGAGLDASVDSLRRLLSELIEERMDAVVQELADIRREAATIPAEHGTRVAARIDELLESLGAERFEAEPMDVVDPLIHVVVAERQQEDVPDGVIVETVRPGYRTSRGWVVCKAAVAVSQRA